MCVCACVRVLSAPLGETRRSVCPADQHDSINPVSPSGSVGECMGLRRLNELTHKKTLSSLLWKAWKLDACTNIGFQKKKNTDIFAKKRNYISIS